MEDFRRITLLNQSGQSIIIAEDSDDYVLDQDGLDWGSANASHNMTQYIDLIGKHLDSTVISPRDISIVGWIIGKDYDEIQKKKVSLNRLINPMYPLILEYGEYALDFRPDSSIQYSKEWNYNNAYMCKFQIQGTAPMPLFRLKKYSTFRKKVDKTSDFHFPLVIPKNKGVKFGYYPLESVRTMPNDGDVASGMTVTLTAGSVDAVNPRIVNETTGTQIAFKYTLAAGDSLIVNTELGQQTATLLQGSVQTNALKYLTIESDIDMTLDLGFNKIFAYADSGEDELDINVKFSPRFLEVEGR